MGGHKRVRRPATGNSAEPIGLHQRGKVAPNSPRELSFCTLSDVDPPLSVLFTWNNEASIVSGRRGVVEGSGQTGEFSKAEYGQQAEGQDLEDMGPESCVCAAVCNEDASGIAWPDEQEEDEIREDVDDDPGENGVGQVGGQGKDEATQEI